MTKFRREDRTKINIIAIKQENREEKSFLQVVITSVDVEEKYETSAYIS